MKKTTEWEPTLSPRQEWRLHNGEVDVPEWFIRWSERVRKERDAEWLKEVEGLVPPEERPRMGSENAETYRIWGNGFNNCREHLSLKEKSMDGPSMLLGYLLGLILGVLLSILASTVNK